MSSLENVSNDFGKGNGTSYQGYLHANYADLVQAFGEPCRYDGNEDGYASGDKTDAEWMLEFVGGEYDGTIVTLYDWKEGKCWDPTHDKSVEQITKWHIGGHSLSVVDALWDYCRENGVKIR